MYVCIHTYIICMYEFMHYVCICMCICRYVCMEVRIHVYTVHVWKIPFAIQCIHTYIHTYILSGLSVVKLYLWFILLSCLSDKRFVLICRVLLRTKMHRCTHSINFELFNTLPASFTFGVCGLQNNAWSIVYHREPVPKVPLVSSGWYDSNTLPQRRNSSVRRERHCARTRYVYVDVCWETVRRVRSWRKRVARNTDTADILRSGEADTRKIFATDWVRSGHDPWVVVSINIIIYVVPAVNSSPSEVFAFTGTRVCTIVNRWTWAKGNAANWLAAHTLGVSKWVWRLGRESERWALCMCSVIRKVSMRHTVCLDA